MNWKPPVRPVPSVVPPPAPVAVASPVVPPCPPAASVDVLMQPKTIQEARADGAIAGTMISAPLAPASGPITVGVEQVVRATLGDPSSAREPMVVVALKALWDSPTIKALRNAAATACGIAVGVFALQVAGANGDLWAINWQLTEKAAIAAGAFSLATAYAAWWKTKDNNAIQGTAKQLDAAVTK